MCPRKSYKKKNMDGVNSHSCIRYDVKKRSLYLSLTVQCTYLSQLKVVAFYQLLGNPSLGI
jgi:hypothetical protein